MKIELLDDGLLIIPETDFEINWLRGFKVGKVFHKRGLTPAEYIGLKLCFQDKDIGGEK